MNTLPDFLIPGANRKNIIAAGDGYRPLLAAWLLDLVLALGWHKKVDRNWIIEDNEFARITEIKFENKKVGDSDYSNQLIIGGISQNYTEASLLSALKSQLEYFRKQAVIDDLGLFKNINIIGQVIGLSQAEKAIFCFVAIIKIFSDFREAISSTRHKCTMHDVAIIISHLSGQSEHDVLLGLRQDSALRSSGIIEVSENSRDDFEDWLDLLSGMEALLIQQHGSEEALIGRFLCKASQGNLTMPCFPHLAQEAQILKRYLSSAIRSSELGTNILLYGIPGTGKTEFVKALAAEMGIDLYEISFSDNDGDPITGNSRLRAYNLCQRILIHKKDALLMFDEIEDVFPSHGGMRTLFNASEEDDEEGDKSGKAWVNRTLERNSTPAIWITNNANMDQAYLRRFDFSIRFPVPPQKVRIEIARHHLAQFNPSEDWLAKIASNEQMTPAQYERAAKVARLSYGGCDRLAIDLVEQALDRSETLLGQKRTPSRNISHTGYDLRFANTGMNMEGVIAGLNKKHQGTFCFYGPAGTGKSELARHIADELDMPCVVRRASDILSMWVGGSEKNIARMFAEARQQEALLVLDEADSFLADRRDARHSWEVTQVNELLTQMEAFNGIFICTTNLMERLDVASLRRFAFKVKFDYLTPDQSWEMFIQEYLRSGGELADAGLWEKPVRDLAKLTPGDFAVASRQFGILDLPANAGELYSQLLEECRVKGGVAAKIGFVR